MYELILHSQIAAPRHNQVLNILAGVTAMQPVWISEQVLIYQQLKSPAAAATTKKGTPNQTLAAQRLRYHKLVRDIQNNETVSKWKLLIEETPDAGVKDVNARNVFESTSDAFKLERFQTGSEWYKYDYDMPYMNQYITKGSRFVDGNVNIRLTRIYMRNQPVEGDPIDSPPPTSDDLTVVDKSGAYVVEAYIRTEDAPSPALRVKANDELLKFAKTLEGAIDLRPINRLSLDTFVKGS